MSRLEASAAATAASKPGSSSPGRGEGQARGTPPAAAPRLLGASAPRPSRRPPPPLPGLLCLWPLPGWRCRKLGRAAVAASSPERAGGRAHGREAGGGVGGGAGGARAGRGPPGGGIYKVKPHCQTCSSDCSSCCRCAAPRGPRAPAAARAEPEAEKNDEDRD